MQRPLTGFAKRRRLLRNRTNLNLGSDCITSPYTARNKLSQKQIMFHDPPRCTFLKPTKNPFIPLVKVEEPKMKRPMTGMPVKKKDPITGEFVLERVPLKKRVSTPASKLSKSRSR